MRKSKIIWSPPYLQTTSRNAAWWHARVRMHAVNRFQPLSARTRGAALPRRNWRSDVPRPCRRARCALGSAKRVRTRGREVSALLRGEAQCHLAEPVQGDEVDENVGVLETCGPRPARRTQHSGQAKRDRLLWRMKHSLRPAPRFQRRFLASLNTVRLI